MQKQLDAKGVSNDARIFPPEVLTKVRNNGLSLALKTKRLEVSNSLQTSHVIAPVQQCLAKSCSDQATVPRQVIDGLDLLGLNWFTNRRQD